MKFRIVMKDMGAMDDAIDGFDEGGLVIRGCGGWNMKGTR